MKTPHPHVKPKKLTVSLSFRPASNGVVSEHHQTSERAKTGAAYEHHSETTVHPTMKHAVDHLKSTMKHLFKDSDEDGE